MNFYLAALIGFLVAYGATMTWAAYKWRSLAFRWRKTAVKSLDFRLFGLWVTVQRRVKSFPMEPEPERLGFGFTYVPDEQPGRLED